MSETHASTEAHHQPEHFQLRIKGHPRFSGIRPGFGGLWGCFAPPQPTKADLFPVRNGTAKTYPHRSEKEKRK